MKPSNVYECIQMYKWIHPFIHSSNIYQKSSPPAQLCFQRILECTPLKLPWREQLLGNYFPQFHFHPLLAEMDSPTLCKVDHTWPCTWRVLDQALNMKMTFVAPHRWKDCAAVSFLFGHVWRFCPSDAGCHDQHRPNIESKTLRSRCYAFI